MPDGARDSGAALDGWIAAAEAAADVAGAVIRPFFRAGRENPLAADLKHDRSPVTVADRTAEQAMRAVLAGRFPEHGIMGEEFGLERPQARLRWVLDPIDGTRAFITGRPTFGTLIALLDGETPLLGVIDQPVTGERWVGAAGRPTRYRGPLGGRAGCRACDSLAEAELSCTSPEMLDPAETPRWRRLAAAARRVSWGGDCYAYGLLALGQIDIVAEGDMKVWDWAALLPVIEGAGGSLTDWEGQRPSVRGVGRILAVGDAALLRQAVALLATNRAAASVRCGERPTGRSLPCPLPLHASAGATDR
jgi:histidinol phosphatase-like enzyme (inositol monophosphatase family)